VSRLPQSRGWLNPVGSHRMRRARVGGEAMVRRRLQLEEEARPPTGARLELEGRAQRFDQPTRDGEPQARPREAIAGPAARAPERLEQGLELVGIDAGTRVLHRRHDASVTPVVAADLDETPVRELER